MRVCISYVDKLVRVEVCDLGLLVYMGSRIMSSARLLSLPSYTHVRTAFGRIA
jgi:hypothetical protein